MAPLIGEHLALDLVNTRPSGADLLDTTAALRAWLELQGARIPESAGSGYVVSTADLAAVLAVRELAARLVGHARGGTRPPAAALDALNRAQRRAPAVTELTWTGTGVAAGRRRAGPLGVRVAAALAEAVAELVADPQVGGVRECAAPDCVLLFQPVNARRRWCSAARCGNRVRVARHHARRR